MALAQGWVIRFEETLLYDYTRSRILLVDDETEFADFVQRGLTYEGYSVGIVHTAQAGRQSILANRPDLVLLDICCRI